MSIDDVTHDNLHIKYTHFLMNFYLAILYADQICAKCWCVSWDQSEIWAKSLTKATIQAMLYILYVCSHVCTLRK